MNGYTCVYCNKWWKYDDPGFVFWHTNSRGQNLDGRDGRARSSLGWFAHCADRDACAQRRVNVHAGLAPEQLVLDAK